MGIKKKCLWFILFALLLVGCETSAPATEIPPTPAPIVLPTPQTVTPLEERLQAAIEVGFPDEIVFVQGFVWVKTDDGRVVQIDPDTNSVVGDIKVDTVTNWHDYCQGLGTDGEFVWACATRGDDNFRTIDVVRIDPATRSVIATVDVGKIFDQYNMPFLDQRIWVLTGDGSKLVGIDTATNEPGPAIELGERCFQVAAAGDSLLVTCKLANLLLRVDPQSMQVTQRVSISPSPWNVRASEDAVWVGVRNAVHRLDPATLASLVIFSVPGDQDLFITDAGVWVRVDPGFLYRIDPLTNQVMEQFPSDQRHYNMGGFIVTDDSVWTSAGDDDLVLRIGLK